MIRKPLDNEGLDCIKLIYMSGPDMISYFMIEREPEIYKYIGVFYTKQDVLFSSENISVKIENEKVCGLLLAVPTKDIKQMDKNMFKYSRELFRITGLSNAIKMLFRFSLQKYLEVFNDDEYYISSLAVFEEYRGKGIGIELLKKAEQLAKMQGYRKLSLAVEFYNSDAKKIYEKFGFCETKKVEFPKKYHKYSLDGFYKMVKVL